MGEGFFANLLSVMVEIILLRGMMTIVLVVLPLFPFGPGAVQSALTLSSRRPPSFQWNEGPKNVTKIYLKIPCASRPCTMLLRMVYEYCLVKRIVLYVCCTTSACVTKPEFMVCGPWRKDMLREVHALFRAWGPISDVDSFREIANPRAPHLKIHMSPRCYDTSHFRDVYRLCREHDILLIGTMSTARKNVRPKVRLGGQWDYGLYQEMVQLLALVS